MIAAESGSKDAIRSAAHAWRERTSAADMSQADQAAFEAWLAEDLEHEKAYDRAVTVWAALDHLGAEDLDEDVLAPGRTERLAGFLGELQGLFGNRAVQAGLVTAALLAFAVPMLGLFSATPDSAGTERAYVADYQTGVGEVRMVELPDGSFATLGAASQIEVQFSDARRTLVLKSGAALFDVAPDKDRPFAVSAGDLTATALGTIFDVRANGDAIRVAVAEGTVAVTYPLLIGDTESGTDIKQTLVAGQQVAALDGRGLQDMSTIAIDSVGAWRDGRLVYDGASLAELIADAQRHMEAPIDVSGDFSKMVGKQISASFDAADIDGMLATLPDILPVRIERLEGGGVRIKPALSEARP